MQSKTFLSLLIAATLLTCVRVHAAARGQVELTGLQETPTQFTLNVLTASYGGGSMAVRFEPTDRLPKSSGEARVERKLGRTEIEIELDEMKPAWEFGGDFNTYVLWAVSPEGHSDNLGEFILEGNRSKLEVSTSLDTFGLIITAEPHFLTERPSPFVVLKSIQPEGSTPRAPRTVALDFAIELPYRYAREDLTLVNETGDIVSSALRQAQVAVQMARRLCAERYASSAMAEAQESLHRALGAAETRGEPTHPDVELMAYRTVRLAVRAQEMALGLDGANCRLVASSR